MRSRPTRPRPPGRPPRGAGPAGRPPRKDHEPYAPESHLYAGPHADRSERVAGAARARGSCRSAASTTVWPRSVRRSGAGSADGDRSHTLRVGRFQGLVDTGTPGGAAVVARRHPAQQHRDGEHDQQRDHRADHTDVEQTVGEGRTGGVQGRRAESARQPAGLVRNRWCPGCPRPRQPAGRRAGCPRPRCGTRRSRCCRGSRCPCRGRVRDTSRRSRRPPRPSPAARTRSSCRCRARWSEPRRS